MSLSTKYWESNHSRILPETRKQLNEYLISLKLENKAKATITKYRRILEKFLMECSIPLEKLTAEDVLAWLNNFSIGKKERTVELYFSALSSFFNFCLDEEYMETTVIKKRWRPHIPRSLPKFLDEYEHVKLISEQLRIRDRALLLFLLSTGCRVSEVSNLNIEDVNLVKRTASVMGKGKKIRSVYFSEECSLVISDYLQTRTNDPLEPLFVNKFGNRLLDGGVKLILSVDDKQTDKIKGGEKEITVEGLEEPLVLTSEEATKHLVLNFNGVSGKGEAKIDNTLSKPLNEVRFAITNDGELKNGEKATLVIDETLEEQLISRGYVVGNDFNPTFEVKGLHIVAENATEIANFKDLERMIDEQIKLTYKDIFPESSLGSTYDIKREKLMYRQFKNEADKEGAYSASNHGNLIGIYTVKKYANSEEGELQAQFTAINGFADIYLDDQQHANPATLKNIQNRKDNTYSLESVIQLYEGYGYVEVK